MKMLRKHVAMASSVAALFHASTSLADEPSEHRYAPPESAQQAPRQQPSRPVQQAPAARREPTGTTSTTAAPYTPPGSERVVVREVKEYPNSALLGTGVGLFLISYAPTAFAGAMSERDADRQLIVPVAGPWMALDQRRCTPSSPCGENEEFSRALIVSSGIVQGMGAVMVLGSLIIPGTKHVAQVESKAEKPSVRVVPISYRGGAGVGLVGRF